MSIVLNILSEFDGKGINKAKQQLKQLETTSQKAQFALQKLGGPAAIAGLTAIALAAGKAIKAASNLAEVQSKVSVIFGKSSEQVEAFAASAATTYGQTKTQALDAAATFATFGKSAGLAGANLVSFSTQFAGLASDLASFNNTTPEQAINAIGSALRGEAEPLRKYGVLLDDASLRQAALALGLIKTTKTALTPQNKVLAAQKLIYEQTSAAQGDFARTSGGLANQQRILAAQMENVKTQIGTVLLPAITDLVSGLNDYASVLASLAKKTDGADSSTKTWISRLMTLGGWLVKISPIYSSVVPLFKAVNDKVSQQADQLKRVYQTTSNVTKVIKPLGSVIEAAGNASGLASTKTKKLSDALDKAKAKAEAARQQFEDLGNAIKAKLGDEISQATTKLEGLQSQFNSFAGTVKSAILSGFSFGNAQSESAAASAELKTALEKQADAQLKLSDATEAYQRFNHPDNLQALVLAQRDLAQATNEVAAASAKPMTFFDNLNRQATKAKDFGVLVNRLVAAGLSDAALAQVLTAGSEGGAAIANEILNSADGVLKANTLTKDLSDLADTIAQNSASHYYGAGVSAATSFLQGLNDTMKTVNITFADPKQAATDAAAANYLNPSPLGGAGFGYMGTLMAEGGIVTRPTTITAGEAGPEAIIPLSKMGSMAGMGSTTVNISVNGGDPQSVVDALRTYMRQNGSVPIKISNAY